MKIIAKTKAVLFTNKAETMVEVTVAFLVLSIVMALFAQGMRFANKAETFALDRSRNSDSALKDLLDTAINGSGPAVGGNVSYEKLDHNDDMLKLRIYTVPAADGGDNFVYYVFDAN